MSRKPYNRRSFLQAVNQFKKELKVTRDRQTINNDYANTCAQIGERTFQISMMEADVESLKGRVLELGKEIKALDDAEKAAAVPVAPQSTEVPNASSTPAA